MATTVTAEGKRVCFQFPGDIMVSVPRVLGVEWVRHPAAMADVRDAAERFRRELVTLGVVEDR